MGVVGRLDQYASMLVQEFDEITANNTSITGIGTYYSSEFNENIIDIVRDGLLLNLDAGNLSSYPGSGTTWTDLSGRGTVVNLSSTSYTTDAGGGIYFSSSASSANFTATLNFSGGFTLETWIKHTGVVSTARIQRYMTIGSSPVEGPVLRHNSSSNGSLHGYLFDSGSAFRQIDVAGQILTNTYYHIVYTYDGTTFRLYKNNVQVGTLVATVTLPTLGTTHSLSPGGGEYFEGNMYVARYYNRGLTAAEVQQNYNALATRYGLATTGTTAPMSANVFPPYDLVYDEFGGTLFGAGQGRYMRQNTDKSVIVYNEIDEVTDLFGRGVVRDGLIIDLDAGISGSYSGSGTAWTDLSVYGNNGTLINGPTYSSSNGGSLIFDGTNDYCTNTLTGLSESQKEGSLTYEYWVKANAAVYALYSETTTGTGYFNNRSGNVGLSGDCSYKYGNSAYFGYQFSFGTNGFVIGAHNSGVAPPILVNYESYPNICHLVVIKNANNFSYYINGVFKKTSLTTSRIFGDSLTTVTTNLINGANFANYFNGTVYSYKLYNRVLTAKEIQQNYNATRSRFGL